MVIRSQIEAQTVHHIRHLKLLAPEPCLISEDNYVYTVAFADRTVEVVKPAGWIRWKQIGFLRIQDL